MADTVSREQLVFEAVTRQASQEIQALRRDYRGATAGMSDDALRLAVAQDKLDRTLSRHGAASSQAKAAELAYRRELEATTHAARQEEVALTRSQRAKQGLRSQTSALTSSYAGLGGRVGATTGAFLGASGLVYVMEQSIKRASDLNEQVSRANVVFGASADEIEQWSQSSVNSLSLTRAEALKAAGDFGTLFGTVGLAPTQVAELSKQLVQLGADLSSFQNTPLEDSLAAIRSGLVGEAEPLRRYGALLSEARVQQEALRETGKTQAAQLTDQEKVLARVALIMEDTKAAQGDLARTSDSYANSTRRLSAELAQLEARAGTVLLPLATEGVKDANVFFAALEKGGVTAKRVGEVIKHSALDAIPVYGLYHQNIVLINLALGDTKKKLDDVTAANAKAWDAQFGIGALTTSSGLRGPRPEEGTRGPSTTPTRRKTTGNPDLDYRIALESATTDKERLALLIQHRRYLDSRITGLKAKDALAGWQKQQLLDLIQKRNQEQTQIDQIIHKSDQDTAAKQAARERAQLAAERRFEQSNPALMNIHRAQARAAATKGRQDDVTQAQREVDFWKNRLEQLDRTSGAYEHVADKLSAAETKLSRAQGKLDATQAAASSSSTATPQLQAPKNLRIRQLMAELHDNPDEQLSADRAVENYWKRKLALTKRTSGLYEEILQNLVSAHDAVKNLEQQLSGSGPNSAGALQNEFLTSMQAILSQVAPNYGSYGSGGFSSTQAYEMTEANREQAAHLRAIANRRGRDEAYGDTIASY